MSFTQEPVCTSRQNCIPCRRDAKFREHFEKKYNGKWECPLSISIDATDDQFPTEILNNYKTMQKQMEERNKILKEAQIALEELSVVLTGDNLARLEKLRSVFFPQSKVSSKCVFSTKIIGQVEQTCCGGTVKKVDAYDCKKHVICVDKKCQNCQDFLLKK